MAIVLVIIADKTTETEQWVVGPFENAYKATDWAEANLTHTRDWYIDELTHTADLPKELLRQ